MERLIQDVRFGLRVLWRDRGFAATTLLTLAICIGANAAIFAIVNAVLLRPLPVPEPGRFAVIYNSYPRAGVERASNGVPDYYDRVREVDAFEEQALYNTRGVTVGIDGDPQRITGMLARPSLLRMLEVHPLRGRIFNEDEGEIGTTGASCSPTRCGSSFTPGAMMPSGRSCASTACRPRSSACCPPASPSSTRR